MIARSISITILVVAAILAAGCGGSSDHPPVQLVRDVRLPGGTSRFDYQSVDEQRHRLYIAHLGASEIVVFDLKHESVSRIINGVPGVHGVLAVPRANRLYAAASSRHELMTFSEAPERLIRHAKAGILPDGIAYDAPDKETFVSDEVGDWEAVFDARSGRRRKLILLGGDAGNVQYDPVMRRALVDVGERNNVAVIDPQSLRVVRSIVLPGCDHDHGLHLDPPRRLAFITCDLNNKLLVLDLKTMKILQTQQVGKTPDVLDFDVRRRLLYVASESGVVAVFAETGRHLVKLGQGFVGAHAHSVAVDPGTGLVYFPLESVGGHPVLRVMRPLPRR